MYAYTYIYIYIYAHTHVHIHIYIYIYMSAVTSPQPCRPHYPGSNNIWYHNMNTIFNNMFFFIKFGCTPQVQRCALHAPSFPPTSPCAHVHTRALRCRIMRPCVLEYSPEEAANRASGIMSKPSVALNFWRRKWT